MKRHLYTSFWAVVSVCMLISQYGFADSPASKTKLKTTAWVSSTSSAFTESETKEPGLSKTIPGSFPAVCTATFTASISVASSTICVGTAVQLSSVASAQASGSYSWAFSGAGAFSGTTQPPTSRTPNYVPSGSGISSFTLTVLRSTGCTATATATVSATQPTVLAGVQSPVGTICHGSTINLTASGGNTYSWAKNGNPTIQQALIDAGFVSTAQNPSYTASATNPNLGGTFTVTATATNSCTNTTTMTLSIQALPAAEIKTQPDNDPLPATICKGGTLTLRANPGPNSNTYSWQGSDSFTSAIRTPMVTFSTTGTKNYTVTVTATTGCSNTATASIEVLELPDPAVSPPQTVCDGTPVNLTAATGMSSYSWVSSSGGFTSASNMLSLGANDVTPGTNYFTVTVTATTGCSATATTSLSVNALPEFGLSYLPEVCLGATISLDPSGADSYSWSIEHNGDFESSTADPLSQTYTSPGYYYYTITGMNAASCTISSSFSIQVGPDIKPRYAAICLQGNTLSLSASGGGSYSWAGPNGFSSTLASPTPKASTAADLGIYSVTVTATNSCTATATVEVYFGAGTITAAPISVCKGSSLQLSANSTHGASYRWTKLGSPTVWFGQNPTVTTNMKAANAGLYTVWITGVNGCIAKQEVLVTMKLCTATRLAADMSGEAEEDIKLTLSENPTNGRMKVSVTLAQESKVQLDWINLNGTKLHGWESSNNQTVHEFDIDVSTSVDGLYLLRASTDTGQKTLRVVKSSDK